MARPYGKKWVQGKVLVTPPKEDCYIYKRPGSNRYQYYLSIPGEGEERKSTGTDDEKTAINVALDRKLEVMSRQRQGLKARRIKKMFDFMDDFLADERKRIAPYNRRGFITKETYRLKSHHLEWLKKFFKMRNTRLEELDYPKLYEYPIWRTKVDSEWNPSPPQTTHTILTELTTIRAYFQFLKRKGYIDMLPDFHTLKSESEKSMRRDYLNPRQYQQTLNTVRAWANSKSLTPTMKYNKQVIYQSMLIMTNSCMRIGELRGLRWGDLEPNPNLNKDEQQVGHLIRIREDNTKVGEPRTVQSPTVRRFEELRKLAGIPRKQGVPFPHVPKEFREQLIITKYNHPDEPMGMGTWNRSWQEIKALCIEKGYWGNKNISWYSMRHTGISFAVSRGVPLLQLARNCGTGSRYIEHVYYHHESESKLTWDTLNQNRRFYEVITKHKEDMNLEIEEALDKLETDD